MSSPTIDENSENIAVEQALPRPRAGDWFWRPWYAKLWWFAIPIYWIPAGELMHVDAVARFYESGYAIVTHMIFMPITALLVLGFGFFRALFAWGDPLDRSEGLSILDEQRIGGPPPTLDMFNPRSGPLWIGNHTRERMRR